MSGGSNSPACRGEAGDDLPRHPEEALLFRVVQEHLETLLARGEVVGTAHPPQRDLELTAQVARAVDLPGTMRVIPLRGQRAALPRILRDVAGAPLLG